jgi:hypothetical protein
MADIQTGDTVFDEKGAPCTVTFVSEVMFNRSCYDVVFDDGTVILADAEHQWKTETHAYRKALGRRVQGSVGFGNRPQNLPRVTASTVTTEQIRATLNDVCRLIRTSSASGSVMAIPRRRCLPVPIRKCLTIYGRRDAQLARGVQIRVRVLSVTRSVSRPLRGTQRQGECAQTDRCIRP